MSYNISSDKFQHPLLKPILQKLTEYFSKEDICLFQGFQKSMKTQNL